MSKNPLFLSEKDFQEVLHILKILPHKVYIYGSRAQEKFKEFSDIDLYIEEDISDETLASLKEAFDVSNLSVKVDILIPKYCPVNFLELIKQDMKLIKEKTELNKEKK